MTIENEKSPVQSDTASMGSEAKPRGRGRPPKSMDTRRAEAQACFNRGLCLPQYIRKYHLYKKDPI